jgi:hypothetical protein
MVGRSRLPRTAPMSSVMRCSTGSRHPRSPQVQAVLVDGSEPLVARQRAFGMLMQHVHAVVVPQPRSAAHDALHEVRVDPMVIGELRVEGRGEQAPLPDRDHALHAG